MGASLLALAKSIYYLQWKAFDLLYKMRYIIRVVALLGACDVTSNSRHLGRHRKITHK